MVVALFRRKKSELLDLNLGDVAKELGFFSEELQSGILDDNTSDSDPLIIATINPNQSQYKKPEWRGRVNDHFIGSLPFLGIATIMGWGGSKMFFPNLDYGRVVRIDTSPKILQSLELSRILQLPVAKVETPLLLSEKSTRPVFQMLRVNFQLFEWFVSEKHKKHSMFKLIGKARNKGVEHAIYLIGRDSHTNVPYLLRCPPNYAEASILSCLAWCINTEKLSDYVEI